MILFALIHIVLDMTQPYTGTEVSQNEVVVEAVEVDQATVDFVTAVGGVAKTVVLVVVLTFYLGYRYRHV